MGYRKIPTIHTLDKIEGCEGLVVRLKGLKVGKLRALIRIMDSEEQGIAEVLDEVFGLLEESAVSWTMEDEGGVPIAFDRAGIESLELGEIMGVLGSWLDKMTGTSEELGKDSTSGANFPGQPLTMEAL